MGLKSFRLFLFMYVLSMAEIKLLVGRDSLKDIEKLYFYESSPQDNKSQKMLTLVYYIIKY